MSSLARFSTDDLHLLGDVHGRWPRVARALSAAGVCDESGSWAAAPGAVLLQVGDLIDHGQSAPPEPLPLVGGLDEHRVTDPRDRGPAIPLGLVVRGSRKWPDALLESERRALRAAQESLRVVREVRRLQDRAAAAGGQVIALLGNHDVDLLRGRFRYFAREKSYLLALLGVPAPDAAAHLRTGVDLSHAAPELSWLNALPLLATDGQLLAVHGGPPRALSEELLPSLTDLEALAELLDAARARGWDDPLFSEGTSLLSPDAREDDAVADPRLGHRLLALAGADLLALGHSPFLHLPKRAWVQADHPSTRAGIEAPARLGPRGEVLKLDTNLKRGGPAWLVTRTSAGFHATHEDGTRLALLPPATPPDTPQPPRAGVDPAEHREVARDLAALQARDPDRGSRARAACNRLLALGAHSLAWVRAALRTGDLAPLESLVAEVEARVDQLAAELRPSLAGATDAPVIHLPELERLVIAEQALHLGPAVARRARALIEGAPPVITASYFVRGERPHVRLVRVADGPPTEATRALSGWPPERAELEALAGETGFDAPPPAPDAPTPARPRTPANTPAPPPLDPGLAVDAHAWATAIGLHAGGDPLVTALAPGRCRVGVWRLVRQPDGALVPVDTTLVDPGRALPVLIEGRAGPLHPAYLIERLGPVERLHSALSDDLLALLRLEAFDSLGLSGPVWRAGRFLFCGLDPVACAPFRAFKPHQVTFALAPGELSEAVEAGLLTVNLFCASDGEQVSPDARWGGVDVAPEVVALGEDGVEWLWRRVV